MEICPLLTNLCVVSSSQDVFVHEPKIPCFGPLLIRKEELILLDDIYSYRIIMLKFQPHPFPVGFGQSIYHCYFEQVAKKIFLVMPKEIRHNSQEFLTNQKMTQ